MEVAIQWLVRLSIAIFHLDRPLGIVALSHKTISVESKIPWNQWPMGHTHRTLTTVYNNSNPHFIQNSFIHLAQGQLGILQLNGGV
jgi:hypothetical protein